MSLIGLIVAFDSIIVCILVFCCSRGESPLARDIIIQERGGGSAKEMRRRCGFVRGPYELLPGALIPPG